MTSAACFVTDACCPGMPPHIAAKIWRPGTVDMDTTMGYAKARELHQAGENPQVTRPARCLAGLPGVYIKIA